MRSDLNNNMDPQAPTIVMPDFSAFTWSDDVRTEEVHRKGWHGFEGAIKLVFPPQVAAELASHGGFLYTARAPIYVHVISSGVALTAKVTPDYDHLRFQNVIGVSYALHASTKADHPTRIDLCGFQDRIKDWLLAKIKEAYQRCIDAQQALRRRHLVERYSQKCVIMADTLTAMRQDEIRKLQAQLDAGKLIAATTEMIVWADEIAKDAKAWGLDSSSIQDDIQYELNRRFT